METYTGSEQSKSIPQGSKIQDGNTGNHENFPPRRGVGDLNRLQGDLLPHTNTWTIQEISEISYPGSDIPVQSTAIRSVHSTHGVHCNSKGGENYGQIHQYLDDWLVRARSHQTSLQHTQDLVHMCQQLGWVVNLEKSELEPQKIFNFVSYQFDLSAGRVQPTPDRCKALKRKYKHCFHYWPVWSGSSCPW